MAARSVRMGSRRGQSVVEYALAVSVCSIAFALGFIALGETTRQAFDYVRTTVQMPYP